jgi:hypothetical protein
MNENTFAFDSRLDTAFLDILYEGNRQHAAIIFEQFLKGIHLQMKEVDDNFALGNIELFRRKVHMLKPVLSFVGLTSLMGKAEALENKCFQISASGDLVALYTDFKNNIVEFIPVIEKELVKLKE